MKYIPFFVILLTINLFERDEFQVGISIGKFYFPGTVLNNFSYKGGHGSYYKYYYYYSSNSERKISKSQPEIIIIKIKY